MLATLPTLQLPHMSSQVQPRGHLEPHVSNLPRRARRHTRRTETDINQPLDTHMHSPNSSSSSNPQSSTMAASPHPLLSHLKYSSSHTAIPILPASPSPLTIAPASSTLGTPSGHAARPAAKGHLAPHVTNLPRRRKRPLTTAELQVQRQRQWERRRHLQEIISNSGVFLCMADASAFPDEGEEDREQETAFGNALISRYDKVVRVCVSDAVEKNGTSVVEGGTLYLFVPEDTKDHGMPHLTREQMWVSWKFLESPSRSRSNLGKEADDGDMEMDIDEQMHNLSLHPQSQAQSRPTNLKILIVTTSDRTVDAVAIALGYLARSSRSSRPSPASSLPPSASVSPAISRHSSFSNATATAPMFRRTESILISADLRSPIHGLLTQIHDAGEDELDLVWRGVLSRDGIEWVELAVAAGSGSSAGSGFRGARGGSNSRFEV